MATDDLELIRRYPQARVFELDHGDLVFDSAQTAPTGVTGSSIPTGPTPESD